MNEPPTSEQHKTGLDDPRAVDILTTEHWSLLSARTLGYQEMFGRATMFIGVLSGTVIALALLVQATRSPARSRAIWVRSPVWASRRPWSSAPASHSCRQCFMSGTRPAFGAGTNPRSML